MKLISEIITRLLVQGDRVPGYTTHQKIIINLQVNIYMPQPVVSDADLHDCNNIRVFGTRQEKAYL